MTHRILFAAYQTDRGSNGGMESATRIFEALAHDFDWTLLTNRETARTERWRAGGARVVRFAFDDHARRPVRSVQLAGLGVLALREVFLGRPHLIHANDIRAAQAMLGIAGLVRRPCLYTVRDTKAPGERYSPAWPRIARKAGRIVTLSDEMSQFMVESFATPPGKLRTINSIVDLKTFRPVEPEHREALRLLLGIRQGEAAIGIVAGVIEKKGQLEFLRQTMLPLLAARPDVHLHLIGDFNPRSDAYAQACEAVARQAPLAGHVSFHGFAASVAPWLQALDCVVVPSRNEGLARCMIEAMACATPVVSFDVCSAREMLEAPGAGRVVPQGNFAAMAEAVATVLNNAEQGRQMGAAGRRTAMQRFDALRVVGHWRQVYRELASRNDGELSA